MDTIMILHLSVNQYLRHNLGYKKYKLFDVTKYILDLPELRLMQQSLSRTRFQIKLPSVLKLLSYGTKQNHMLQD